MTKEVRISVCGVQQLDGEVQEPAETVAAGSYYNKNGRHYVLYETADAKNGAMTKYRIKFCADCLELTRMGDTNVHMTFRPGVRCRADYRVPAAAFRMDTVTRTLHLEETEERIDVRLEYALELEEHALADYILTICIRPEKAAK